MEFALVVAARYTTIESVYHTRVSISLSLYLIQGFGDRRQLGALTLLTIQLNFKLVIFTFFLSVFSSF